MKTTGITRRIDELGRIVIPKEIRKNMHIKTGEMLEIFLDKTDTISLKKHSILKEGQAFMECFIKNIGKKTNSDIYLLSLNNVVFSTDSKIIGMQLSKVMEDNIISNKFNFKENNRLEITDGFFIEKEFDVFPLLPNADLSGFLIFRYNVEPDSKVKEYIKFSTEFITEYLEEN